MSFKLGDLNIITLILIALKLFDVISVSWWIVFLPTFVWIATILLIIVLVTVILIVGAMKGEDVMQKMEEFNKQQIERRNK